MTRFNETVNIRPVSAPGFDTSSLVAALDSFAESAGRAQAQKTIESQKKAGFAAFQEGKAPEFKEEKFLGRVSAKAYNEGLRAAYVASIDRDNREEVSRISKENESDLIAFNEAVESYRSGVLNNVDPSAKEIVGASLDDLISSNRIRVQNNEIERRHKENAQEVEAAIDAAATDALGFARDGDMEASASSILSAFASISAAEQAGFLTAEEAALRKREIEKGAVEESNLGALVRTFDDRGEMAAYQELDALSKKRPKGFAPEEWDKFIANSQTELRRKAARLERDAIGSAKQAQLQADFSAIEQRIAGDDSQIINPKAADAYYRDRVLPAIENAPTEVKEAAIAEYMDRLKLVPDTMVSQITNAANSNNPDLLREAASLIDRIDETPGIVNKVPKQQQAYIGQVVELMQNMSEAEAVDLARKATDPKDKARIEAVDSQLKDLRKDDPDFYLDSARSAFGGVFFDPDVNEVSKHKMSKEYQAMFDGFMRAGSTEDQAKKKADQFIKRSWGKTSVLGREEIMKYPPEDYYSIDGDVSWIKPQLMSDIRNEVFGLDIEDVFIMSNDRTARTAEIGQPSYAVKVLIDGVFHNIENNWRPDQNAEIEKRKNENVESAMARRRRRAEQGADPEILYRSTPGGLF